MKLFNFITYKNVATFLFLFFISLSIQNAQATSNQTQSPNAKTQIEGSFCKVLQLASGNVGKTIIAIAIIFVGTGFFLGKMSWSVVLATVAGSVCILLAPEILLYIDGSGSSTTSTFRNDCFQ